MCVHASRIATAACGRTRQAAAPSAPNSTRAGDARHGLTEHYSHSRITQRTPRKCKKKKTEAPARAHLALADLRQRRRRRVLPLGGQLPGRDGQRRRRRGPAAARRAARRSDGGEALSQRLGRGRVEGRRNVLRVAQVGLRYWQAREAGARSRSVRPGRVVLRQQKMKPQAQRASVLRAGRRAHPHAQPAKHVHFLRGPHRVGVVGGEPLHAGEEEKEKGATGIHQDLKSHRSRSRCGTATAKSESEKRSNRPRAPWLGGASCTPTPLQCAACCPPSACPGSARRIRLRTENCAH